MCFAHELFLMLHTCVPAPHPLTNVSEYVLDGVNVYKDIGKELFIAQMVQQQAV